MANDLHRLKQEADISLVVRYLGLETWPRGSNVFIRCPSPNHIDNHPTNCYFKPGWNHCRCMACGKGFNAIDLIMYVQGCGFLEAVNILWEIEGKPDWYYEKGRKHTANRFSISLSEMKSIGINFNGRVITPVRESKHKEFLTDSLPSGYEYYQKESCRFILCRSDYLDWHDFMSDEQMKNLIAQKCVEKEKRLDEIKAAVLDSGFTAELKPMRSCLTSLRERVDIHGN